MVVNKHGSFYMRSGWGTKIIQAVKEDDMIFSTSNEQAAIDSIGLGRIMIKALRYWSDAMGLTCEVKAQNGIKKEPTKMFERNVMPCHDSLAIEYFTIDDLDMDSVITYKEKVNKRFPKKKYLEMSNQDFLTEIGVCFVDRVSGEVKLRRGAFLFLGQERTIKEVYPHYHLDYFNRKEHNPRWIDRVSDDEPSDYEMNLFNFYSIVYEKMKILLKESFELDEGQLRIPLSDFDEVLRECLINCLAHADYVQAYPSVKIEVFDGWFHFLNPGKMLVSLQQFRTGGDSRPRNEIIMKMFRWLGASERQGYGGPLIYTTTASSGVHTPEVYTDIEKTDLKI